MSDDTGADLIAAERRRQIEAEGWTPEHDDVHGFGDLSRAAMAYLAAVDNPGYFTADVPPAVWPWDVEWWKPSDDPIRNLVKAGALIAAEIDRRHRADRERRRWWV